MKKPGRKKRGQFVIIAALLIAALTLATAIAIYEVQFHRQTLRYRPVNEFLLGTTSDMERAVTVSLAKYTVAALFGAPNQNAFQFMTTWQDSVLASYANYGLVMSDPLTPTFDLKWDGTRSYSLARVLYDFDVNSYGFKGWSGIVYKYVRLQIFPDSIDISQPGKTSLVFQLTQSALNEVSTVPISDLPLNTDPTLFRIGAYQPGEPFSPINTASSLMYRGNGNYTVTFSQTLEPNMKGVRLDLATPEDGIWISANYYNESMLNYRTLWFDNKPPTRSQDPIFNFSEPDDSFQINAPLSHGHGQVSVASVSPCPQIVTSGLINMTLYIDSSSKQETVDITAYFGFFYPENGAHYAIGDTTISNVIGTTGGVNGTDMYMATITVPDIPFVSGFPSRTIPQGSIITLDMYISGAESISRIWIYYGVPYGPSHIDLF